MDRRRRLGGYDTEAEFYDLCWSFLVEDIRFYRRRIGKPGRLLDLMCGTGRVGLALAQAGWQVDGVDQSAEMLRVGQSKLDRLSVGARSRMRFHHDNLLRFNLPRGFDAAVIPVDSFPLILSRRGRVAALRNVRNHLKVGGKLLVHVDTPASYETARGGVPSIGVFRVGKGGKLYIRCLSESFIGRGIVRGITVHLLVGQTGRVERRATSETRTRVLAIPEVVRELKDAGFDRILLWGDYRGGRVTRKSTFVILEAAG
jgi:SAM-dependent methyltransferase